jgi:hypothetical protein
MNRLWLGDPKSFSEMKANGGSGDSHELKGARKTFHDGQLLEVDGTAGVVRVLDN